MWTYNGELSFYNGLASMLAELMCQTNLTPLALKHVRDPSPSVFIGAVSIFTLTALCLHHVHKADRYQSVILIIGVACALLIACVRHLLLVDDISPLNVMRYLMLGVVISSSLSAIVHRWSGLGRSRDEVDQLWQNGPRGENLLEK